jgi:hypothetical protein
MRFAKGIRRSLLEFVHVLPPLPHRHWVYNLQVFCGCSLVLLVLLRAFGDFYWNLWMSFICIGFIGFARGIRKSVLEFVHVLPAPPTVIGIQILYLFGLFGYLEGFGGCSLVSMVLLRAFGDFFWTEILEI